MSKILVPDAGGDTITVLDVDGCLFPMYPVDAIRGITSLKLREDDVMICAFPKSVDYGSWFDYVREWENAVAEHQELPVLTLCYEDIKEDPIRETKKICAFLGMNPSELFLEAVCQKSSFEDMKKRLGPLAVKCEGGPWNFRKGTVGDWKNWFTVSQNEWFDRLYEEKMKESSLKFRYSI